MSCRPRVKSGFQIPETLTSNTHIFGLFWSNYKCFTNFPLKINFPIDLNWFQIEKTPTGKNPDFPDF